MNVGVCRKSRVNLDRQSGLHHSSTAPKILTTPNSIRNPHRYSISLSQTLGTQYLNSIELPREMQRWLYFFGGKWPDADALRRIFDQNWTLHELQQG
jgi:hypothetical protein